MPSGRWLLLAIASLLLLACSSNQPSHAGFRKFARNIDEAFQRKEVSILASRLKVPQEGCFECSSDRTAYTRLFENAMRARFSLANPELEDRFGSGSPRLYATATSLDRSEFYAITTWMWEIRENLPQRVAYVFSWRRTGGRWELVSQLVLSAEPLSSEHIPWLTGQCTSCYSDWRKWE